jgi:hypothetical protein
VHTQRESPEQLYWSEGDRAQDLKPDWTERDDANDVTDYMKGFSSELYDDNEGCDLKL